ncbi:MULTISPECIES: NAD(P)H-dependent flavin oxidoreductase [unclassified Janthinobacterium]|uniref:NAD(P)H-dependent flavin oxidoreductase n=1 Tax=unclassified Janthinobacterium TaxID=2610881 RepID=UPI0008F4ABF1|nr:MULTISPECIES: nitronate monooxygenase [unclassified Janthinobacterium]APA67686.1 2-nitropropane dioxygenase [Janthinobacterium sp. 1_2014MBL_MicDiv]MDN2709205.1 nitronate monooxygenase [Janthinobacterium sp. SUN118]
MSSSLNFFEQLSVQHPIVQAPMAGVSTPQLAAAVSDAGALGSLGIGASTPAQARQMIAETQALTGKPFNVNVFCHAPARRDAAREAAWLAHLAPLFAQAGIAVPAVLDEVYPSFNGDDEAFRLLLELRPAVVSFHFGLPPAGQLAALRQAGIRTMATATNVQEAVLIEQAGIDAIVAQGVEAGGHRGMFDPEASDERLSMAVLVRLLVKRCTLPVIAAGGIMDGAGIRAALDLGAAGAQLGTAFILCPETAANAAYRANLQSERATHTRLTAALSGRPARGIVNDLMAHGDAAGAPLPAAYPVAYDAAKQLHAAAAQAGNHGYAAHWAGQGAPLVRAMPAAELVRTLLEEMRIPGRAS